MEIYNSVINKTYDLLSKYSGKSMDYSADKAWSEDDRFELIMLKDAAFEFGGGALAGLNYTCLTSDPEMVSKNEIIVYGPDIPMIKENCSYTRIAVILTDDFDKENDGDSEKALKVTQDIDFVKYHIFPKGFMVRTSPETNKEQVRVGKAAISEGISFEGIGNAFIKHYLDNPHVKAVKLIFITDKDADFSSLKTLAGNVRDITKTMSKILEGMPTDCKACNLKPICDEVEGMKELHFGKGNRV